MRQQCDAIASDPVNRSRFTGGIVCGLGNCDVNMAEMLAKRPGFAQFPSCGWGPMTRSSKMRFLILALSLAFSASVAAADIGLKADRMAAGSVMVMKDSAGAITHVKRGQSGDLHVFDTFDGQGRNAAFIGSYHTNARGEITAMIAADGAVTRFAPHRCTRTVGKCSFTIIHADGFQEQRSRVTQETRNGLRYQEFGLDGLIAEGALELDHMGVVKNGWKKKRGQGRKVRSKRVLIALK